MNRKTNHVGQKCNRKMEGLKAERLAQMRQLSVNASLQEEDTWSNDLINQVFPRAQFFPFRIGLNFSLFDDKRPKDALPLHHKTPDAATSHLHKKRHESSRPLQCRTCQIEFASQTECSLHRCIDHKLDEEYYRQLAQQEALDMAEQGGDGMDIDQDGDPEQATGAANGEGDAPLNEDQFTSDNQPPEDVIMNQFRCRWCGFVSDSLASHSKHSRSCPNQRQAAAAPTTSTKKSTHSFQCSECSLEFILEEPFERHLKQDHKWEHVYSCPFCKSAWSNRGAIARHTCSITDEQIFLKSVF
jgi:rubredoxin